MTEAPKSEDWKRFENTVGKLLKSPPQPKPTKTPAKKEAGKK